jgi:glycosyltransferase involved in cell wall biosynthesis
MTPRLSVVIPARNAAPTIRDQLDALAAQDTDIPWEVVVADNGSTDTTRSIADSFAERLEIAVVDASGARGAAGTRNVGVSAARGDRLLFTDADDVVGAGWIAAHAAHEYELATGPIPRFETGNQVPGFSDHLAQSPPTLLRFLPYAPGPNLGVSRSLFERLGGFDERFLAGEDVELSWRAQVAHGVELSFVPRAVVAYRSRAPRAEFRQYRRYGRYDAALYREYREHGIPPVSPRETARAYAGIVARLPIAWDAAIRSKVMHQLGRRVGRIEGSLRYRVMCL